MDSEIKSKILEVVSKLESFASDTLPAFAQEIVSYKLCVSIIGVIVSVIVVCFCYKHVRKITDNQKLIYEFAGTGIFLSIVGIIFFFIGVCKLEVFCKAMYAPKMLVLEYLLGLCK